MDKHLDSPDPAYVGETVTFHIDLSNTLRRRRHGERILPVLAMGQYVPASSPPSSGTGNAAFANQGNAAGQPDGLYSTTNFENNTDTGLDRRLDLPQARPVASPRSKTVAHVRAEGDKRTEGCGQHHHPRVASAWYGDFRSTITMARPLRSRSARHTGSVTRSPAARAWGLVGFCG